MDAYLITCIIILVAFTLIAQAPGFLAGLITCFAVGVVWAIVALVVQSDDCKQYEGGISDTYYENCY